MYLKKKFFLFFLTILFIFSSCSDNYNENSEQEKILSKNGVGLEVDFNLEGGWKENRINYLLEIKNSGINPITINKENFKIETDYSALNTILDKESINTLNENIFGSEGSLTLYKGNKRDIKNIMSIKETYWKNPTNKKFFIIFTYNYNYNTKQTVNLKIQKEKTTKVKADPKAAPVQISSFFFENINEKSYIDFDINLATENKKSAEVSDFKYKVKIGQHTLENKCRKVEYDGENSFTSEFDNMKNNVFNGKSKITLRCEVLFTDEDIENIERTTQVTVDISYNYKDSITKEISFPDERYFSNQ